MFRGSHRRCSVTKGVLRNFSKFTGKHLRQILSFNKVAGLLFNKVVGLRPATLLKDRPWHRCFAVNFCEISNNTICYRTPPACNFIKKETLAQVFSCEFWEILRTLFVTEHLRWLLLYVVEGKLQQSKLKS